MSSTPEPEFVSPFSEPERLFRRRTRKRTAETPETIKDEAVDATTSGEKTGFDKRPMNQPFQPKPQYQDQSSSS